MTTFIKKISRFVFLCAAAAAFGFFIGGTVQAQSNIPNFSRDLTVGSRGADVLSLQQLLNASGFAVAQSGPGSADHETTLFGYATRAALAKFQAAHGISATGYFGAITRGYLISIGKTNAEVTPPNSDNKNSLLQSQISLLKEQLSALLTQSNTLSQHSSDTVTPVITAIAISGANSQFVSAGETIAITFSEAIDPRSVNANLNNGSSVKGVLDSQTGGVNVTQSGEVIINGIADFSVGSVQSSGSFGATLALDAAGRILTVTLGTGNTIRILTPNLSAADQIGGSIKDMSGNPMVSAGGAVTPTGIVGGENGSSLIDAINISNGGKNGYIDDGDTIAITFDKPIDPKSIDSKLYKGGSVSLVPSSQTGGVNVTQSGEVIVNGIADFGIGSVQNSGGFGSKLSLNITGKILTVALVDGLDIRITSESLASADQIGGTVRDENGNIAGSENAIVNPTGSFGGSNIGAGSVPYISAINVFNGGKNGFIDNGDRVAITFNEAINPKSLNANLGSGVTVPSIASTQTGGISVSLSGNLVIDDIADFNLGSVSGSGNFQVKMSLDSTGRILTLQLTSGNDIGIANESFASANQAGGTVKDNAGNVMTAVSGLVTPTGTFGGQIGTGNDSVAPYITSINIANGGDDGYIDNGDMITITFSEPINPKSINGDLSVGDYVNNVVYSQTGGVAVSSSGEVAINGIADFDMGSVANSSSFTVQLGLDAAGKILTIILADGASAQITNELFASAYQIGNIIKDTSGNKMASQTAAVLPLGTFGGKY